MASMQQATRAYQAAADHRGLRMQEADVFYRATGAMRAALGASPIERTRALADNRRLWLTVMGVVQDAGNGLPDPVRALIMSVGHTVQREMDAASPDFDFLISVNDNIAAGLSIGP